MFRKCTEKSFVGMKGGAVMEKFVIVAPRQGSGGSIVQHLLCKMLAKRGYDAKIFYIGPTSMKGISSIKYWMKYLSFIRHDTTKLLKMKLFSNAKFVRNHRYMGYNYIPVRGCKRKYLPIVDDDTIVVYSEGIWGNPLRAKHVVRWFLFFNRFPGDYEAYGKMDLFFSYRSVFNDDVVNPLCRRFRLRNFDYELYKNHHNTERNGTCYIVRKGINRQDLPTEFDGPIIDEYSEREIVDTFNKCKYCISYDTQTFYATIASICGCISIVIPEPGKTRADYTSVDDKIYGVAYGNTSEEVEFAKKTRDKLIGKIDNFKEDNKKNIDFFIKECNRYFKNEG